MQMTLKKKINFKEDSCLCILRKYQEVKKKKPNLKTTVLQYV